MTSVPAPTPPMPRALAIALCGTDELFLLYWTASALGQAGVVNIPRELMYAHYDQPQVIAWNWSVLPVDLAFSVFGLAAVASSRRGSRLWPPLALAFTLVAGTMAIGYWTLVLLLPTQRLSLRAVGGIPDHGDPESPAVD